MPLELPLNNDMDKDNLDDKSNQIRQYLEEYLQSPTDENIQKIYDVLNKRKKNIAQQTLRHNSQTQYLLVEQEEDMFQEFLIHLFCMGGIEKYISLQNMSFSRYWINKNKEYLYNTTFINQNVIKIYSLLKKMSIQYDIPLIKENAYLFEKLGQGKNCMSISQICRIIEEAKVINELNYSTTSSTDENISDDCEIDM